MDDDVYNALEVGDLFGSAETITDRHEDRSDIDVRVLNELGNSVRRVPKRPLMLDSCEAIDWHLRVPCTFDEIEGKRKKKENDEIILNRLTERILQARFTFARNRHQPSAESTAASATGNYNEEESFSVLKYPPIDGTPWTTVSTPNCCRRFYLRLKKSWLKQVAVNSARRVGVFNQSSSSVVSRARESLANSLINTSDFVETDLVKSNEGVQKELWVDKYSPRVFADLVSDDKTNRILLNWIKLWDECVFKKTIQQFEFSSVSDEALALDDGTPQRPKHKVVLLAGPAGLGKTMLAKVVAQHAGYKVVDVNASDDRNVADFEKRIEEAVRTVKTLDADARPICLLLDEIDGAPVESIRLLCKIVSKSGRSIVRRPIICICNNLYASSLRELRSAALVLQMPHSDEQRLMRRLNQIANLERMKIDSSAVSALVSVCSLDLRSCINGLQYLATHHSSCLIDRETVMKYGNFDNVYTERSLFDAWSCILEQKNHFDRYGKLMPIRKRTQHVCTVTERCAGDTNRFFMGLFGNYLNAISGSKAVFLAVKILTHLCDFDLLMSYIGHSSNFSFLKYTTVTSVMIHYLTCSPTRIQILYPLTEQTFVQKRKQSSETLQCVKKISALSFVTDRTLILDFLPLFIVIVQPFLKQTNAQLFDERDVHLFREVVSTMIFYSITFKSIYENGETVFTFLPSIETVALFPLNEFEDYRQFLPLPKSARQAIAHEIDLVNLGRSGILDENLASVVTSSDPDVWNKPLPSTEILANKDRFDGLVYRYNHGFSNAIRRNIRMRNLVFDL